MFLTRFYEEFALFLHLIHDFDNLYLARLNLAIFDGFTNCDNCGEV